MHFATAHCQTRRRLEEQTRIVINHHADLTTRLFSLVGHNRDEFLSTLDQCQTTSLEINDSRKHVREHRRDHGC